MIQAVELRKGNLLNWSLKLTHPETTLPDEIIEVAAVMGDKIAFMYANLENRVEPFEDDKAEFGNNTIPLSELQPIRLTEEWLNKMGLELDGEKATLQSFYFHWNGEKLEGEEQESHVKVPAKPLQYVHQLQNYFEDVTGLRLDINFNWQ
jgi:hypothetical protein